MPKGSPPPSKGRVGWCLKALAGERTPEVLPVLMEPVPFGGRCLTHWEYEELVDWGLKMCRPWWRVAPIPDRTDRFSLWALPHPTTIRRIKRGESNFTPWRRRAPVDLAYQTPAAAVVRGTFIPPDVTPEDPPT